MEIHSRHRPRRRPGGVAALVPRAQAEQPAAQHSPRHAAGQPGRRLCHRRGDCLFRPGAGHRSGMAATDHHRVLRRPDHFLHLFRRGRQPASGGPPGLGRRGHRDARQRLVADDPAGVVLDELDAGQIAQREDRPCKAIN